MEAEFQRSPQDWKNDIDFFRLGVVCWYVDAVLGVAYREDQRHVTHIRYTDPTDLFLNGVMDTRRGTCGNLAMLHVVLGRRIGLPVSVACVGPHYICRFDDGKKVINIETTETGRGGFASRDDAEILSKAGLSSSAQGCGSDLRAVTARELLGLFIGARARHYENTSRFAEAESDYLLARHLFPANRKLAVAQNLISVQLSMERFEPNEKGHPIELARWLQEVVEVAPWNRKRVKQSQEKFNGSHIDAIAEEFFIGENFK